LALESLGQPDRPHYRNQVALALEISMAHEAVCYLQDILDPLVDFRIDCFDNTDKLVARPTGNRCCGRSNFLRMSIKYSRLQAAVQNRRNWEMHLVG